ncbi:hypothetical protein KQX54_018355 [Cotesia glomerata]|uniref:Uncharacterized protein n=1 Tax=Cotesia glomerata TaxID=32391 RepID=A0AAV7I7T7_COTGL|nr:hypothetical protein KQX54_018355 [Cotesia glomerata]
MPAALLYITVQCSNSLKAQSPGLLGSRGKSKSRHSWALRGFPTPLQPLMSIVEGIITMPRTINLVFVQLMVDGWYCLTWSSTGLVKSIAVFSTSCECRYARGRHSCGVAASRALEKQQPKMEWMGSIDWTGW